MSDKFFKGWFLFVAILSLSMTVLFGWAIVQLVQWVVTK